MAVEWDDPETPRQRMPDDECCVCDEPIGNEPWDWAAMRENGPVHSRCFMTPEQLFDRLLRIDGTEDECDTLYYMDGINNCTIHRDGRIIF